MLPHPNKAEFDPGNALECARWSMAAYGGERPSDGVVIPITARSTDTQCLVQSDPDCILIAFRGTEPRRREDWITDLKCRRADGVHRGFQTAWTSIAGDVLRVVRELRTRHQTLVCTGHSLGGALAVLCAHTLMHELHTAPVLYTFGQPRLCDSVNASILTHELPKWFRVVNEEDIVPRLPLWTMGYRHGGTEAFMPAWQRGSAPRSILIDPPLPTKLVSDIIGLWCARRHALTDAVSDHAMDRYLTRMEVLS